MAKFGVTNENRNEKLNWRVIHHDDDGKLIRAWEFENMTRARFQVELGKLTLSGDLPKEEFKDKRVDIENF